MAFNFPRKTVYLISPDPKKIEGLELAWKNLKILSGKSSPYLRAAKTKGADIEFLGLSQHKTTADLLQNTSVQKRIRRGSRLLVFKNLPKVEKIAEKYGWQLLMPKAKFINLLEDKINFVKFCHEYDLPLLTSQVVVLNRVKFSKPIVVQLRRGHAGESTYFVKSAKDLSILQKTTGEWTVKITPLKKLPTFSLNLCVGQSQTYSTQPFFQITGDPRLNPLPGGTGGIDFDIADKILNNILQEKISNLVEKIGSALRRSGYRGIAGIDFLADTTTKKIHLIELNPRLLSNLGFVTKLQKMTGETPLLTIHLLELLGIDTCNLDFHKISQVKKGRFELPHQNVKIHQTNRLNT